jgi:NADPH2:quinone reductase
MHAMVVEQPGSADALRWRELADPSPAGAEVLVAIDAAGVNPVDTGNRMDGTWAGLTPPYVVGYEFAGTVLAGDGARLRTGDAVWGLLPVRGTRRGAYAERIAVDAAWVTQRPAGLDSVQAAVLPLAAGTALQVLDRLALPSGAWLLVHGAAGGVGHLLVQIAVQRGLRVAAASRADDRERMLELGVELWVDRAEPDVVHAAAVQLGRPFDGVADLVGGLLIKSLPALAEGAQAATIVDLQGDYDAAIDRNVSIHGVLLRPGQELLIELAAAVGAGLTPTVSATYPLARAAEAHRRLERGGVGGKIALTT